MQSGRDRALKTRIRLVVLREKTQTLCQTSATRDEKRAWAGSARP
ncbi:hypothetical protein RSSM_05552 [Rhodopirellula sallentina SM41]|uniref:Uncharacterized protein n=1 Tax=Rhodopirellula sallentina SM41 TaxID=1263870 RepID=M5UAF5_9BACT|nr:hypothetical protein RSSM_05552 [Rhodopirellula sallentina SM41]